MSSATFREHSPGTVIRNGERSYAVEEEIGRSKFGRVFACRDDQGEPRVLQAVWPFSRSYEAVREGWARQAAELRRVRHPGLVDLLDGFEHQGCFHLVHERFDHRLDQAIGSPDWDGGRWFEAVARPVLCALEHAHRGGYTHRNLHPRNVFCAVPFAAVKLGDMVPIDKAVPDALTAVGAG